jgi:hypothetical protein
MSLVLVCAAPAAQAKTISFCLDKANPMIATDAAIANAVAASRGDTATLITHDSTQVEHEYDSGKGQEAFFRKLAQSCDIIMGFPVETQVQNLPPGMAASRPYIRTGFVTATTGAPITAFSSMSRSTNLGVVMLTVASTYFTDQTMAHEYVYDTNDQLYGALLSGEVAGALIWQPWLDHELTVRPAKLRVAPLDMPHAAWNIVALYPRAASSGGPARDFNSGIASLAASGRLAALVQPYQPPTFNR